MRLTTRTNLAMRILMYCAVNTDRVNRSADIAEACNSSVNHLVQVVPELHRRGFVHATRGRAGGVTLGRPARNIRVGEVFRVFESGLPFAECFDPSTNTCPLAGNCRLRDAIKAGLAAFYRELDKTTLADLVKDNTGLETLLWHAPPAPCPGPAPMVATERA